MTRHEPAQQEEKLATTRPEPGIRDQVVRLLWEKQFEHSPWGSKFHLLNPDSLEADYGRFADKLIEAVTANIKDQFTLVDRREQPMSDLDCTDYAVQVVLLKCREANPQHMSISASGATVMEWFADALRQARSVRSGR